MALSNYRCITLKVNVSGSYHHQLAKQCAQMAVEYGRDGDWIRALEISPSSGGDSAGTGPRVKYQYLSEGIMRGQYALAHQLWRYLHNSISVVFGSLGIMHGFFKDDAVRCGTN
jgi:hypothetical protein